jgi:hypothetical protein
LVKPTSESAVEDGRRFVRRGLTGPEQADALLQILSTLVGIRQVTDEGLQLVQPLLHLSRTGKTFEAVTVVSHGGEIFLLREPRRIVHADVSQNRLPATIDPLRSQVSAWAQSKRRSLAHRREKRDSTSITWNAAQYSKRRANGDDVMQALSTNLCRLCELISKLDELFRFPLNFGGSGSRFRELPNSK